MAERRAIKSSIWDDEFFGELDVLPKLVWIGLFSKCSDDQGRMLDNAALICSKLFPYGGVSIDQVEQCLIDFDNHVIRYQLDGKKYIQLPKWWENQPLQYAVPSNYPPPPGWKDRIRTYYKGIKVVYNWPGLDDTASGTSLIGKLGSLGRVSTWMDYVGSLNLNPNPIINPNLNLNSKDDDDHLLPRDPVIVAFDNAWPGSLSSANLMLLDKAVEMYTAEWVIDAITEAVKHNAKSFSYADKILQTRKANGGRVNREPPKQKTRVLTDPYGNKVEVEG
jgi:hypothetical protein